MTTRMSFEVEVDLDSTIGEKAAALVKSLDDEGWTRDEVEEITRQAAFLATQA